MDRCWPDAFSFEPVMSVKVSVNFLVSSLHFAAAAVLEGEQDEVAAGCWSFMKPRQPGV